MAMNMWTVLSKVVRRIFIIYSSHLSSVETVFTSSHDKLC